MFVLSLNKIISTLKAITIDKKYIRNFILDHQVLRDFLLLSKDFYYTPKNFLNSIVHLNLTLLKFGAPSVLGAPSANLSIPSKASVMALSSLAGGAIFECPDVLYKSQAQMNSTSTITL